MPKRLPTTKEIGGWTLFRRSTRDFDYAIHVKLGRQELLLRVIGTGARVHKYQAQLVLVHHGVRVVTLADARTADNAIGWVMQTYVPSALYRKLKREAMVSDG